MGTSTQNDVAWLLRERDFCLRLLELSRQPDVEPFLEQALALIVEISQAERGYLQLHGDAEDPEGSPRWWRSHGCTDEDIRDIRAVTSRGIVAEALTTGQTVHTACAGEDPRFGERSSIRQNSVQGVLCVAVGSDPPLGVVYLQGRVDGKPFSLEVRRWAELFARHVAPVASGVLSRALREVCDPTRPVRKKLSSESLVGRSEALASVLQQAALIAPLDIHVLLTGPSGTGKTALARVIAANGPRAQEPFVELNCAALPAQLIESELFGAEQGAHSTAVRAIPGKVAAAERGTLLLDEVSELDLTAQGKLLQLLHSKKYYPLGASQPVEADVRIIAASNVDLATRVAERRFREDLYYRLQVMPIDLPPLRHRREDIIPLAEHFCQQACKRHNVPSIELSPAALRAAEHAEWPGNIRQLANTVEAGVIRASGEGVSAAAVRHLFPASTSANSSQNPTFQDATRQFQQRFILKALEACDWNVTEAAKRIDVARSHLYSMIRACGLERPDGEHYHPKP